MNLAKEALISVVQAPLLAGLTDGPTTAVDMSGYQAVAFIAVFWEILPGGTTELKIQESDEQASGFVDVPGAVSITPAGASETILIVEARKRTKRWLRAFYTRAGASTSEISMIIAIQHSPRITPVPVGAGHAAAPVSV